MARRRFEQKLIALEPVSDEVTLRIGLHVGRESPSPAANAATLFAVMPQPKPRPELLPRAVQVAVVDAVGGWGLYKVREIADLFLNEGFTRAEDFVGEGGGQRRNEAAAFQAAIDFSDPSEVERYLRVVEKILDDHDTDQLQETRQRLLKALTRADIHLDERGRLRLPAHRALSLSRLGDLPTESGIRLHLARLERLEQEPEEMIGAAKELVEATIKHVLLETGEEIPENSDIPALNKRALARLKIHPEAIAPTTKGAEVMVRILGGLAQTAAGLAELRNLGYGTGHGQSRRIAGLKRRHAEFAARSAIAYVAFVLDTLGDIDAPWRRESDKTPPEGHAD
jgi:Abortive infection C-terminus